MDWLMWIFSFFAWDVIVKAIVEWLNGLTANTLI